MVSMEGTEKPKKDFDPDLSPKSEHNRDAAKDHGLTYDKKRDVYRDADGSLVRDRFGQPF